MDKMSQRAFVVFALSEEKARAKPNETVLEACRIALRKIDEDIQARCALHIEMSQPRES